MPHELISFPEVSKTHPGHNPAATCPADCVPIADTPPQVSVRWGAPRDGRDGNVQLTLVEHEKPPWSEWNARINEALHTSGRSLHDTAVLAVASETRSMVLSYSDVDRLIQVLCRARDQAYVGDA